MGKRSVSSSWSSSDRSFASSSANTVVGDRGQIAHRDHIAQSHVLRRHLYEVRPGVWCVVGNGLSNQTFIDAPDGVIAIDTGESTEEMRAAIGELRAVCDRPIVAVMYTHFHYVGGTEAVFETGAARDLPVWGHAKIAHNRSRVATEVAPTYSRGLVEQFAVQLPMDGPDGVENVGLGFHYRNPAHAPFTSRFVPPNRTFDSETAITVAGLEVEVTPAPSDADDSVTFWFPALKVAVHNLVWPVLFNVFAIRGEEYRDPRVLVRGVDHLLTLGAEHLVAAHGPPMSGTAEIARRVTRYRDAIQFLWDQTVRHANMGEFAVDIGHNVSLPPECDDDYLTAERYGVAEHHVRQIRNGLFGFFDGDESRLFPLPTADRAARLIAGFGGREAVRAQCVSAIESDDLRWALELGSWLVHADGAHDVDDDRRLLARALRLVGQRTTAANIRSWCLTRALVLEGSIDITRLQRHNFNPRNVLAAPASNSVSILKVLIEPTLVHGVDVRIAWQFENDRTGLHIRHGIAHPYDGIDADHVIHTTLETWAMILGSRTTWSESVASGAVHVDGSVDDVTRVLAAFDPEGLRQ